MWLPFNLLTQLHTHTVNVLVVYIFALKLYRWMNSEHWTHNIGFELCAHPSTQTLRKTSFCFSYCLATGIFYLRIILLIQIARYWNNGIIITAVMVYTVPNHLVMEANWSYPVWLANVFLFNCIVFVAAAVFFPLSQ